MFPVASTARLAAPSKDHRSSCEPPLEAFRSVVPRNAADAHTSRSMQQRGEASVVADGRAQQRDLCRRRAALAAPAWRVLIGRASFSDTIARAELDL